MDKRVSGGRVMKDDKRRRTRGAVQVEYAFLLLFVMVPTAAVLLVAGTKTYNYSLSTRSALLSSMP
jgi:Flp pilus assembly pilin Flp